MDTTRYAKATSKPRPCLHQRTLDAIGRRDAHVLSTIVRAASSSGHDQL